MYENSTNGFAQSGFCFIENANIPNDNNSSPSCFGRWGYWNVNSTYYYSRTITSFNDNTNTFSWHFEIVQGGSLS